MTRFTDEQINKHYGSPEYHDEDLSFEHCKKCGSKDTKVIDEMYVCQGCEHVFE